ncbi:hypothetical protein M0R45_015639 [Rubus argutus]|uniref:Uncharacterized protein n=1 Tax=Rubus argutus TaxID=59490 RepID=A0AAW1XR51_RUBAR
MMISGSGFIGPRGDYWRVRRNQRSSGTTKAASIFPVVLSSGQREEVRDGSEDFGESTGSVLGSGRRPRRRWQRRELAWLVAAATRCSGVDGGGKGEWVADI